MKAARFEYVAPRGTKHIRYDDPGQLLTRTLMDYLVPSSAEMPDIEVYHL